jgi:NAD-dependent SIR2 family protein deacetylase
MPIEALEHEGVVSSPDEGNRRAHRRQPRPPFLGLATVACAMIAGERRRRPMPAGPEFARAAAVVQGAAALVVTAGAGMGVDSGLPDFRGTTGFWGAYPLYERLGLRFEEAANPIHFARDPAFGWGFYGHRLNLYRATTPHPGFALIRAWAARFAQDCFVATSNVDGQFQQAGFAPEQVWEVHGSIHHLQCLAPCSGAVWPNEERLAVDEQTMRADRVPRCRACGGVARPNILMFDDWSWVPDRSGEQEERFEAFLARHATQPMAVLEIGAGSTVATIRHLSLRLGHRPGCTVVRINPREAAIGAPHVSLACGALEGLRGIEAALAGGRGDARTG